ncbi:MAG TPA: hypothetical protein VGS22_04320 [Thermoanaerobaculia bacterium]|jgi:hypothetical protein|nr:hypothetical protein [Thermoanaerobaculia bacterium]
MPKKIKKRRKRGDAPYDNGQLSLQANVRLPSYHACLSWMRDLPEELAITFDCWARGNFVRRLLHGRHQGVHPIFVAVTSPAEMRWVYRRLALTGVPVDLIYHGPLSPARWVEHWLPLDIDIDCAWGYIGFFGTIVANQSGRRFVPTLGYASLMPEDVPRFILDEAPKAFAAGNVFVAPAPQIGFSRQPRSRELGALADLSLGAAALASLDAAMAVLDFELPLVDGMTPADFESLLVDHQDELREFQVAFKALATGYHLTPQHVQESRARVSAAVDELVKSAQHARLRLFISKCRGSLTTFPMAMGMLAAAGALYGHDPFAGAAAVGASAKALHDLWKQAAAEGTTLRSPCRLLLRLGVSDAQFGARPTFNSGVESVAPRGAAYGASHWLCPPTGGLRAAVAGEEKS